MLMHSKFSPSKPCLRIFMYHGVGHRAVEDSYGLNVTLSDFTSQMDYLQANYQAFAKLDQSLVEQKSVTQPSIAVTFDDGYKNNLDAAEVLQERSIPFSIFCIAEKIGTKDFLSRSDLEDLLSLKSCVIGAHGLTHEKLGMMPEEEQRHELQKSKDILQQLLGRQVTTMSLPHGSLNARTLSLADTIGFNLVCSSRPGLNHSNLDLYHLRRTEIRSMDTMNSFIDKCHGADDWRAFAYLGKAIMSPFRYAQWRPFAR